MTERPPSPARDDGELRDTGGALAWLPFALLPLFVAQELRALATADTLEPTWSVARLGVPLVLVGLASLRARWPRVLAAPVLVLLGFELFADRATLAYFGRAFGLDLLALRGQLGDVHESAASLVGALDLALLGAGWLAALVLALRRAPPPRTSRARWALLLGALLLAPALGTDARDRVGLDDAEAEHAARHGLPATHLRDMARALRRAWSPPGWDPADAAVARAWLDDVHAANSEPSPLFGLARGRSVLLVQLEAFQQFVLDARLPGGALTPELTSLAAQGLRFDRCYDATRLGRTSDAELMVLTGLPAHSRRSTAFHLDARPSWPALPAELAARGWATRSFHAFEPRFWNRALAHPLYGIERLDFRDELAGADPASDPRLGWGLPDDVFYTRVVPRLAASPAPFFGLAIALSSHHPFRRLPPGPRWDTGLTPDSMADGYLRLVHFSDAALGALVRELRAADLWERLVIVLYGDHDAGLDASARAELRDALGVDPGALTEDRVPLVVLVPGREAELARYAQALRPQPLMLHDVPALLRDLLGLPPDPEALGLHPFVPAERRGVRPLPHGRSFLDGAALHTLEDDLSGLDAEALAALERASALAAARLRAVDGLLEHGTPSAEDLATDSARGTAGAGESTPEAASDRAPRLSVQRGGAHPLPDGERAVLLMPRRRNGLAVFLELRNDGELPAPWSLALHDLDGAQRLPVLGGELPPGVVERLALPGNAPGESAPAHGRLRAPTSVHAEQFARFRLQSGRYPVVSEAAERWHFALDDARWRSALLFVASADDAPQSLRVGVTEGAGPPREERVELPGRGAWSAIFLPAEGDGRLRVELDGRALVAALHTDPAAVR